jgi:tetratricopeptide (TPR) repeat protein
MSSASSVKLRAGASAVLVGSLIVVLSVASGSRTVAAQREPVTFTRDVAPIVYEHCSTCHRPGEAAPFSLLTYDEVKQRARLIADATASHYMPPWQPDSESGEFDGDRRLSDHDIDTLQRWASEGAVEGDPRELPPPPPDVSRMWRLGKPDVVVTLPEVYDVPADGPDVFRNFVIPIPLSERKFVKAIEFRPGNPRVVHHVRILLDDTGDVRLRDAADPAPGFGGMDVPGARFPDGHFLGWAPGKMPAAFDSQWPLDPGTDFVLQLHLKPSGRVEPLQPQIALYFIDKPAAVTPIMLRLGVKTIDIPANDAEYEINDSYQLPVDVSLRSIYPHAHYLAKEMTVTALRPDGSVETLLHIPNWNFNWQDEYHYRRPIVLHKGTTIQLHYTFDNSAANPHNPSRPPRRVRFGSETTDEMGELLLQVLPAKPSEAPKLRADNTRKSLLADIAGEEKLLKETPDDYETRNALGVAYAGLGRGAEAARQFLEVVRLRPDHPMANYNLGVIAISEGRLDDARAYLARALDARPDYAEAHNNLGVLLESSGALDEAFSHYQRAVEARPANAAARANLGRSLLNRGDVDGAIAQLNEALRLRPDHPDTLYTLGRAALADGHPEKSVTYWKRALAVRPESLVTLVDLAWLLAQNPAVQSSVEAVKLAERANKLAGNKSAAVLDVLAAAYAAEGRLDLAARVAQRAFQQAVEAKDDRHAAAIRQRLETYLAQTEAPDRPRVP